MDVSEYFERKARICKQASELNSTFPCSDCPIGRGEYHGCLDDEFKRPQVMQGKVEIYSPNEKLYTIDTLGKHVDALDQRMFGMADAAVLDRRKLTKLETKTEEFMNRKPAVTYISNRELYQKILDDEKFYTNKLCALRKQVTELELEIDKIKHIRFEIVATK